MISYAEARSRLTRIKPVTGTETVPLSEAFGRVLAEDTRTPFPSPSFTNSQMDGFCFSWRQIAEDMPVKVISTIYAGQREDVTALKAQEAIRVMTGAPLPPAADTVIPIEKTEPVGIGQVRFFEKPAQGSFVRNMGEDLPEGTLLLPRKTPLNPEQIAILANFGFATVKVFERCEFVLLTTGDELLEPGTAFQAGKIYDANSYYLSAALRREGFAVKASHRVPDNIEYAKDLLSDILQQQTKPLCIITSGAVSAGDKDFIPELAAQLGFEQIFHKVAIRPGKPVFVAEKGPHVWLGMPGNPISNMVGWHFFGRPLLESWARHPSKRAAKVQLTNTIRKPKNLRCFYRAIVENSHAHVLEQQGSAHFRASLTANAFVILPEEMEVVAEGDVVEAYFLND